MSDKKLPTLQHPFIDGLKNPPQNRTKELKKIRLWLNSQPHLPHMPDEFLYLFLHACYYNHDQAKHAIETYCTIRGNAPLLFGNRNVYDQNIQVLLTMGQLARMPKTTPEGYRVLIYVVNDTDPAQFVFNDAVKGFCMYNDCMLSEDGLAEGYIVIFDMKHVKLGHVARVNLPSLRAIMAYIQEAHPARLKGIHIVNTAPFVKHIMRLIAPMVRNEIFNLLRFHRGPVPEGIPKEILPSDYGGDCPSMDELGQEVFNLMDKYVTFLKETEYFVADESKRVKKSSWWSIFNGNNENSSPTNLGLSGEVVGDFKNMELD